MLINVAADAEKKHAHILTQFLKLQQVQFLKIQQVQFLKIQQVQFLKIQRINLKYLRIVGSDMMTITYVFEVNISIKAAKLLFLTSML